jgi:hypothetical protein
MPMCSTEPAQMSDQDHGLSQERRHARKGRGYGGPCFDARRSLRSPEWIGDADLTGHRSIGIRFHNAEIRPVRAKFAAEQFHARIAPNNAMTLSRIDWL